MENPLAQFFRPKQAAPSTAHAASVTANAVANQQPDASAAGNAATPKSGEVPGTTQTPANPLDVYRKMVENAANPTDNKTPQFTLDSKMLSDVSRTMDFTKGIDPDLMQKAMGGDAQSMIALIQEVGRNTYEASLGHTTALTNTYLETRTPHEQARIDAAVKGGLTTQALHSIANYDHPVARAELNRVASRMQAEHPDQSPAQIAQAAHEYLTNLATALNPKTASPGKDTNGQALEMDWGAYLTNKPVS